VTLNGKAPEVSVQGLRRDLARVLDSIHDWREGVNTLLLVSFSDFEGIDYLGRRIWRRLAVQATEMLLGITFR